MQKYVSIRVHLWLIFRRCRRQEKFPPASACSRSGAAWICRRWKPRKAVRARAAGDVVSKVLKGLRIDDRRAEAELVKVWN